MPGGAGVGKQRAARHRPALRRTCLPGASSTRQPNASSWATGRCLHRGGGAREGGDTTPSHFTDPSQPLNRPFTAFSQPLHSSLAVPRCSPPRHGARAPRRPARPSPRQPAAAPQLNLSAAAPPHLSMEPGTGSSTMSSISSLHVAAAASEGARMSTCQGEGRGRRERMSGTACIHAAAGVEALGRVSRTLPAAGALTPLSRFSPWHEQQAPKMPPLARLTAPLSSMLTSVTPVASLSCLMVRPPEPMMAPFLEGSAWGCGGEGAGRDGRDWKGWRDEDTPEERTPPRRRWCWAGGRPGGLPRIPAACEPRAAQSRAAV